MKVIIINGPNLNLLGIREPGRYGKESMETSLRTPVIEVHISNVNDREEFRRNSMIAPACKGTIQGFGLDSYRLAIEALSAI